MIFVRFDPYIGTTLPDAKCMPFARDLIMRSKRETVNVTIGSCMLLRALQVAVKRSKLDIKVEVMFNDVTASIDSDGNLSRCSTDIDRLDKWLLELL